MKNKALAWLEGIPFETLAEPEGRAMFSSRFRALPSQAVTRAPTAAAEKVFRGYNSSMAGNLAMQPPCSSTEGH